MNRVGAAMFLGLAACGGGDGGSTGPGAGNTAGTFTAVIDGQNWVSTTNQTVGATGQNQVPGVITITGTRVVSASNATTITLTAGYLAGPATYPLGVNFASTAGGSAHVSTLQGTTTSTWSTGFSGSAGTIAVTSLTSNRIVGTFQFNAPPQQFTSATGTKVVTTGVIDMPLPAGFVPAPANNRGSKASATIGGTSWNAATVVALGSNGVFAMTGANDTFTISLSPNRVVTAGNTYPIGGPSPAGTMSVTRAGTSQNWNSVTPTPVGSITITSFAGNRMVGTFSATLAAGAGTTGSLVIVNGTFDVRVDTP